MPDCILHSRPRSVAVVSASNWSDRWLIRVDSEATGLARAWSRFDTRGTTTDSQNQTCAAAVAATVRSEDSATSAVSSGSPCFVVALGFPLDLGVSSTLRVDEGAAVDVFFAVAAYADFITSSGMGSPATLQYACTGNKSLKSMPCLSLQFLVIHDTAGGRYVLLWLASQMPGGFRHVSPLASTFV